MKPNAPIIKRIIMLLVIFFLGFGANRLAPPQNTLPSSKSKSVGISQEATSSSSTSGHVMESAMVLRVIDGDTIELSDGRRVRYIGMDTPETVNSQKSVQCFGREASDKNKQLVSEKTIQLEKDVSETDKYGRILRYVYVDGFMVNDYLIRQGFAHVSTFPPDVKYQDQFVAAQREARESNRGLWSGCRDKLHI